MVSIIIPNYNHSPFLEERIESVLNQTYRDFEVIILDDCSTDNSRAIIEKYRHNEKISAVLFNTKNSGSAFPQWKKGIDLAKGEYTWIAESDDSSSPLFLEKLLPLLVDNNTAMAFSDSMTIDEYGNEIPGWKTLIDIDDNVEYKVLDGNSFIKQKMIFGNRINNASAVVFKTGIAKQIAEYEHFKYAGDRFLWCNMMFNSSFIYVNKKLNFFRQHQNRASITGHQRGETQLEDLRITGFLLEILSAGIFFRMYIGGYHFSNFSKETKCLDREIKKRIFCQYEKTFPNVLFCACYFFFRKASEKMSLKSVLRKFIPPKIRFLRRVIRNGFLKKYCAECSRFRRDSKLRPADLPNYLSIVAIVKNETPYIAEWIEYHLLAGARRFFIYDNESTDNLRKLLEPYIRDGIVEYIVFPGKRRQVAAYDDAIRRFKYESFWLAFIDIDEFLVPVEKETVPQFLVDFEDVPGIEVNQVLYGSGGRRHKTEGLVMERFKSHSHFDDESNRGAKSIVNPRYVFRMATPHEAEYFDGNCAVDIHKKKHGVASVDRPALHNKIRLNHYGVKSFEEFAARIALGKVYYLPDAEPVEQKFSISEFYVRDLNDIQNDPIMDKYIPLVKERLRRRSGKG